MDVNHIRPPRQITCEVRHALGEKNVARVVVRVADIGFKINSGAVKKCRMFHEINHQPLFNVQRPQIPLLALRAEQQIKLPVHADASPEIFRGCHDTAAWTMRASWPACASAFPSAPTMSARPPVLENGCTSLLANKIFIYDLRFTIYAREPEISSIANRIS